MASKAQIAREGKRTEMVHRYAAQRAAARQAVLRAVSAGAVAVAAARKVLASLPRDASPVRQRKRCFVTGRSRGVFAKFGLCRHELRKRALAGEICGMTKASW